MSIEEVLEEYGYEDVIIFKDYDYETAFVGVTHDGRAVYDFELMVEYLQKKGFDVDEAEEWISYNTLRALPYMNGRSPVVFERLSVEEVS